MLLIVVHTKVEHLSVTIAYKKYCTGVVVGQVIFNVHILAQYVLVRIFKKMCKKV